MFCRLFFEILDWNGMFTLMLYEDDSPLVVFYIPLNLICCLLSSASIPFVTSSIQTWSDIAFPLNDAAE